MLNWTKVLRYIKGHIALPSSFIEKNENEIKEWVIDNAIPEFSDYWPDWEHAPIIPTQERYIHPSKRNHFLFFDDEDLPIYGLKNIYFPLDDLAASGHPMIAPYTFEGMTWWSLSLFKSKFMAPYSNWARTFKFIQPNIVRILPGQGGLSSSNSGAYVVEYEREQPHDLRKIPSTIETQFKDLALAHVQIWIGNISTLYVDGRITTPFCEIPLHGESLKSEGKELRDRTVETLAENSLPPIIIDIG